MLILGHTGIGAQLVSFFSKRDSKIPLLWVCVGSLFPDILDKSLFYFTTGWVSSAREWGHTLLFSLILVTTSFLYRNPILRAFALGCLTHVVLDVASDMAWCISQGIPLSEKFAPGSEQSIRLLWPLMGTEFPPHPFHDFSEHATTLTRWHLLVSEGLGAFFLFQLYRREKKK